MGFRQCEGLERVRERKRKLSNCRSRNNKAVWMVDGRLLCTSCFEHYMESRSVDECRINRLSDQDCDFPESARQYTARV